MEDKAKISKKVGILGIICNLFLLIIKLSVGLICTSFAMIADAVNSAGDIFASLMTYIGSKIANEPSDDDHNYGHGKAEYIFSLFIGISMIASAIKILYDSTFSIINKSTLEFSIWLVVICITTILIKFILYLYCSKKAKQYDNILIDANSQDHRNDIFVTLGTLAGICATRFNIFWLDGVVGCIISLWICYTGFKILIASYDVLMDKSINKNIEKQIIEIINSYPKIEHIDKITSKPVGNSYLIIIKVSVDGNMTVNESHTIAGKLKYDLLTINHISDVIVHINPA